MSLYYNTHHLGNIREVVDYMEHVVQATNYHPLRLTDL
jgi:hypothetical protein